MYTGEELPMNERQIVFENGTLLLKAVAEADAGLYTCIVTQGQWSAKRDVSVQVLGKSKLCFP